MCLMCCFIVVFDADANNKNTIVLQPTDSITLDSKQYISMRMLKSLVAQLDASKELKLNEECGEQSCQGLTSYYDLLFNIEKDLDTYQSYLYYSILASAGVFSGSVESTIKSEDYKNNLQNLLIISQGLTQLAILMTDVTSIHGAIKLGSGPVGNETVDKLVKLLQEADDGLTILNNTFKIARQDGETDMITEVGRNDDISKLYTIIKSPVISKALNEDFKFLRTSIDATPADHANVRIQAGAMLVELLSVWAKYEQKKLIDEIWSLEKILRANKNLYTQQYKLKVQKQTIYDYITVIQSQLRQQMRNVECVSTYHISKRDQRESFAMNRTSFGSGLQYYKSIISKTISANHLNWKGVKCVTNKYSFLVRDGLGKEFPAELDIRKQTTANDKYIKQFEGTANGSQEFELLPGKYRIIIPEHKGADQIFKNRIDFWNYDITGNENKYVKANESSAADVKLIALNPYGRIQLEVVDQTGIPIAFSYTITDTEGTKLIKANNESTQPLIMDLPVDKKLDFKLGSLNRTLEPLEVKAVSLVPGKMNKLRYVLKQKAYRFKILDGLGSPITPYFKITRKSDGKMMYNGPSKSDNIRLARGNYMVEINESINWNFFRVSPATITNVEINTYESNDITLRPYGRVNLEVVDKAGKPIDFRYAFKDSYTNKTIASSLTAQQKPVITDVQANVALKLEVIHAFDSHKTEVTLNPGTVNKLKFVYDNGKFESLQNTQVSTSPANLNPDVVVKALNNAPYGWVAGTLYNSNDGSCKALIGEHLRFTNRFSGTKFLNMETGEYVESLLVPPGGQVQVAIKLDQRWHLRAYQVDTTMKQKGGPISFWFPENMKKGWWYAVGCYDGTRPKSNCDNGVGVGGYKSSSSCKTLGG